MGEYFHKITVCDSKDMDKNNEFGCSLILKKNDNNNSKTAPLKTKLTKCFDRQTGTCC